MGNDRMTIVSVNTGRVALLGKHASGREVYSGIRKAPIFGGTPIRLTSTGLDGDEQADHRVHGAHKGKAVYFYPRSHYGPWVAELGYILRPGDFGENVTIDDIDESTVIIGEHWRWGEAILEVTGPRRPCYKLNMLRGNGTAEAMMSNGRCGWYCRVVTPGVVPTRGQLTLLSRPSSGATTILEAFREKTRREPTIPGPRDEN